MSGQPSSQRDETNLSTQAPTIKPSIACAPTTATALGESTTLSDDTLAGEALQHLDIESNPACNDPPEQPALPHQIPPASFPVAAASTNTQSTNRKHPALHASHDPMTQNPPEPIPSKPSPASIPPPPTTAQLREARRTNTVATMAPSPTIPYSTYNNLQHPPGYIQNPTITQPDQELHVPSSGPPYGSEPVGMGRGKYVWDPAPGEAGGRYVYEFDDKNGQALGYNGQSGRGEDGEGWGLNEVVGGVWESTVSLAKMAGSKLVQVEEGVWRWVNSRS
ncbi:hypothetical protein FQN57_006444 [Myotisia sp. PD_48]|nr:hypothetical protein FQN57_006444 [Myotisia sp. PD_48]